MSNIVQKPTVNRPPERRRRPDSTGHTPDDRLPDAAERALLEPILGEKAAGEALRRFSLRNLLAADRTTLLSLPHVGPARAGALLALPALLERLAATEATGSIISCSRDVFLRFRHSLGLRRHENFMVLALSSRNTIMAQEVVAVGTVNSVHVAPADIVRVAIRHTAPSILCLHNHPSGDPTPSAEDRALTDRISRAAGLMGLRLLDHMVITGASYYSFSDSGVL